MIGAGAKILGNIEVGHGAKIGAGSVVLQPVPMYDGSWRTGKNCRALWLRQAIDGNGPKF